MVAAASAAVESLKPKGNQLRVFLNRGRDRLSNALIVFGRQLATDKGWATMSHRLGAPNMLAGLLNLQRKGFRPKSIVDGGACRGDWSRLFLSVFPEARILLIEPQPRHEAALTAMCRTRPTQLIFSNALLGPPDLTTTKFFVLDDASGGTGSSVMQELSDVDRHALELPVKTLDSLVASHKFPEPDFIKLDVQGYELEVLKGAALALKVASHVLLEVGIREYNAGGPLLQDVVSWMAEQGFRVSEIFDLSRDKNDGLLQIDLLFTKGVA